MVKAVQDIKINRNSNDFRSFTEPLQLARRNELEKALVPYANTRQLLQLFGDIMEHGMSYYQDRILNHSDVIKVIVSFIHQLTKQWENM